MTQSVANGGKFDLEDVQCGYCGPLVSTREDNLPFTRYTEGSDAEVSATINGIGYGFLQVSLCIRNDSSKDENEACAHDVVLYIPETESFIVPVSSAAEMSISVRLPLGVTCEHCILRWSLIEDDTTCSGCSLTTVNCADIAIDPITHRRTKRQASKTKRKSKKKSKRKQFKPLLPPLRVTKGTTTTTAAPTRSSTKTLTFLEMVKQMVVKKEHQVNTIRTKDLKVMKNTQPPPSHFASQLLYVSPNPYVPIKVRQDPLPSPTTKRFPKIPITASPPIAYAKTRNIQTKTNTIYNKQWQQPQTVYRTGANEIEKPVRRDKNGHIKKTAPSNAFLNAIRRFKKDKMGLKEIIQNDMPQLGEFHGNMDITRVKKIEKPENHRPSDNLLDEKANQRKGLLPSKHDFFDKASKSRITSTTRAIKQTNPTTKAPTTKAPTTKAPTTKAPNTKAPSNGKAKSSTQRPRTEGIRNLAKNAFLEAIMKLKRQSPSMPKPEIKTNVIAPKPQRIVSQKTKTTLSNMPTTRTITTTKLPPTTKSGVTPVTQSKQKVADNSFFENIKRLQHKQEELHNQQGSQYGIQSDTHTTRKETKAVVIHTVTPTTTTQPSTKATRKAGGGLLPMWGRRRKTPATSKSTTTSSTSRTTTTSAKTSERTSIATAAFYTSPSKSETRTSTRTSKTTSMPTTFYTSPQKSNSETTGRTESVYPSTQEFQTPEILPLEDNPFINYFVILPPVDEMETKGTTMESGTTSPIEEISKTNGVSEDAQTQYTSKFTTSPSELSSNDHTSGSTTSLLEKPSEHTSIIYTSTKTTLKSPSTYLTSKVTNKNSIESTSQKSSGTGKLASVSPNKESTGTKGISISTSTQTQATKTDGFTSMTSPKTMKTTPSTGSTTGTSAKTERANSALLPLKRITQQEKTTLTTASGSSVKTKKAKSGLLPFKRVTQQEKTTLTTASVIIPAKTTTLNTIPKSETLNGEIRRQGTTVSVNKDTLNATEIPKETPLDEISALAFKELFKPEEFKRIQNRKSTSTGRTTQSDVASKSTEKRGIISTSEGPGSILNATSSNSPTTIHLESDMPDAQTYRLSTKSMQHKNTPGLHVEMHKNINGVKSYDLLEKQLHDKLFEPDTHSNLRGPVYLDMVHEDMYKTQNGKTKLLKTIPTTTETTTVAKRKGGLLQLLSKETKEKKTSGFLLPLPITSKSSTPSTSAMSITTTFSTTQTPLTTTLTSTTRRTKPTTDTSSVLFKMQELRLRKLQQEIENLKIKLLEIHQYSVTSRVPITHLRTASRPTTPIKEQSQTKTTKTTQAPTTTQYLTTTTTHSPTTTTQAPTTTTTTPAPTTTTKAPTTMTTQAPTTITTKQAPTTTTTQAPTTTTTQAPTTQAQTTQAPTTQAQTTQAPTTTTTQAPTTITTTQALSTTTTQAPTTTTTQTSTTEKTTTPQSPTTTIPTTTTESVAVLIKNFMKIFRPLLYRQLHLTPKERQQEPAVIPMNMVKRTTRSPGSTRIASTIQVTTPKPQPTTTTTTTTNTSTQTTTTLNPTTTTEATTPTTTLPTTTTTQASTWKPKKILLTKLTTVTKTTIPKTTLSEKVLLKQLLMEHHPDVYNRLYNTKAKELTVKTTNTGKPTTDPLTAATEPFVELTEQRDPTTTTIKTTTLPPTTTTASIKTRPSTTSIKTTPSTTSIKTRPSTTSIKTRPSTTSIKTTPTTTSIRTTPTSTSIRTTPTTTITTSQKRLATLADKKITLPGSTTPISFYEFLAKAKSANIPIPPNIHLELKNIFGKSTTGSTTTTTTTIKPVDPQLIEDFNNLKTRGPVRRWKPPSPIQIYRVKTTQEATSPYRTTITTRKSTTVTPAPTTNKTPSVAEFLDKYREMYEHGVDKQEIVQSIFQNIDIDTLADNKALFNELLSTNPPEKLEANYSPSTNIGYPYDATLNYGPNALQNTPHNYGPNSFQDTQHNYGPNALQNPDRNVIHAYSERQSNRDGSPGLSAYDNRVMGVPVVPLDNNPTQQPFRFARKFRIDSHEPVGWGSPVNDIQIREYMYNDEQTINNIKKNPERFDQVAVEAPWGSFDTVAVENPNSGFVSNNNEGFGAKNTRPPVLQLENTVAYRKGDLSSSNHGPLVVGPSGSLMKLGMVNKLQSVDQQGSGAVIMSKSLGANLVLHAQDRIGGEVFSSSGTLSQNPRDIGPQDFTMKKQSGSLSSTGIARSSHLSAPRNSQISDPRTFRLRRSTRHGYEDQTRRRDYMLEEQYLVTSDKLACVAGETLECKGIGEFKDITGINWFCLSMCEGDRCPLDKCQCGCRDSNTDKWRPITVK